jgi:hypothetical protein
LISAGCAVAAYLLVFVDYGINVADLINTKHFQNDSDPMVLRRLKPLNP